MRKLALFVEGQTERIFCQKLITYLAGEQNIIIHGQKAFGGRKYERFFYPLEGTELGLATHYILLVDCGSDGRVTSDIVERMEGLAAAGFEIILGLRDLRPIGVDQLERLKEGLVKSLAAATIPASVVVAVTEVETWFLGEHTHFIARDPSLTVEAIAAELGINLISDDLELRPHAAEDLNGIYSLAGLSYDKSQVAAELTVEALDWSHLEGPVSARFPALFELTAELRQFFT